MVNSRWPGASRAVAWILPILFTSALVTWILGIVFTAKWADAELVPYSWAHVDVTALYFYACGLPMAVTLASGIECVLYRQGLLLPIASIVWSLIALGLWMFMLVIWAVGESDPDAGSMYPFYHFRNFDYGYAGSRSGLYEARLVFGCICAALSVVYLSLACVAVDLKRKAGKVKEKAEDLE